MSNLYSYFQRIEPKKMASTTADDESIRQANNTPKHDNNGTTKKNQTPKESLTSSRKPMNMSDVYSSDSPKSEKRKQSSTIAIDDDTLQKNKSEIIV
jgi:hypothetical protein